MAATIIITHNYTYEMTNKYVKNEIVLKDRWYHSVRTIIIKISYRKEVIHQFYSELEQESSADTKLPVVIDLESKKWNTYLSYNVIPIEKI